MCNKEVLDGLKGPMGKSLPAWQPPRMGASFNASLKMREKFSSNFQVVKLMECQSSLQSPKTNWKQKKSIISSRVNFVSIKSLWQPKSNLDKQNNIHPLRRQNNLCRSRSGRPINSTKGSLTSRSRSLHQPLPPLLIPSKASARHTNSQGQPRSWALSKKNCCREGCSSYSKSTSQPPRSSNFAQSKQLQPYPFKGPQTPLTKDNCWLNAKIGCRHKHDY